MTANINDAVSSSTVSAAAAEPRSTAIDAEFEDDDDLFGGLENYSTAEPELPPDEMRPR
jgi:hypothetical protein